MYLAAKETTFMHLNMYITVFTVMQVYKHESNEKMKNYEILLMNERKELNRGDYKVIN